MKTFNEWTSGLGVFFLLAIIFMVANPAFAAKASGNKNAGDTAGTVAQAAQENQGSVGQSIAEPKGPPTNPGPGCYKKIHGKDDKTTYKYFKNGHPENPSNWKWIAEDCTTYGQ